MIRRFFAGFDTTLFAAVLPIIAAGLVTMTSFSGETSFFSRQLAWALASIVLCMGIARIDVRFLRQSRILVILYLLSLTLLAAVLVFGKTIKGSQSWIDFGGISIQPTDFAKIFVIGMLAKYFSRRHVEIANPRHLYVSFLYVLVPTGLVLLQPDFGSAIIILGLWLGMALIAGISRKHLLLIGGIFLAAILVGWLFLFKPYQKARIISFVSPMSDIRGSGYNAYQSMIAVGSGQFLGKGVGYGTQSRLNFLPEYQTDFIFAAFAEEWGFVGALIILACFGVIIWRLITHASRGASNFETLFCAGFAIMLLGHLVINVGMNIGLMPITGLPLPFMSYGGSHLLAEMIGLGIVFSMSRYERAIHRDDLQNEFVGYA
ncbi:MAG TPA: rod shape-determining protein RodA [Candidatus Paceibacterota bacterium]|nr:rod shape-determining protein RodA [Candidatus Paceibacterota bacterium]